jgi:hypothetical protein
MGLWARCLLTVVYVGVNFIVIRGWNLFIAVWTSGFLLLGLLISLLVLVDQTLLQLRRSNISF